MRVTRKAEYAISALVDLALQPAGEPIASKDIAQRQGIPANLIAQIISALHRRGWVRGTRGPRGGVSLACSPEDISLSEVIELIEGPVAINRCLIRDGECERQASCPLHGVWAQAQRKMLEVLRSTSIQDLVNAKRAMEGEGAGINSDDGDPAGSSG